MEQGKTPEAQGNQQGNAESPEPVRLASKRQCALLQTYINGKFGHQQYGRPIEPQLVRWSQEQLKSSLKAA